MYFLYAMSGCDKQGKCVKSQERQENILKPSDLGFSGKK